MRELWRAFPAANGEVVTRYETVQSGRDPHMLYVLLIDDESGAATCSCPGYTNSAVKCRWCNGTRRKHGSVQGTPTTCTRPTRMRAVTDYAPNVGFQCTHIQQLLPQGRRRATLPVEVQDGES